MKILVAAHPDDCILWFNPKDFDKIILCFMDRHDNYKVFMGRRKVLGQHPLKDKIEILNLVESGYQSNKVHRDAHQANYKKAVELLREKLKDLKETDEVWTHNSWGEYGHSDHILISEAVREVATCPVYVLDGFIPHTGRQRIEVEMDLDFYKQVKDLYTKWGAWTWRSDYEPPAKQYYYKIN